MTLLAPNGKPSNLTPEQYRLVRTPEFKAFFGDWEKLAFAKLRDSAMDDITLNNLSKDVSKVVDENGEPLVVYRGNRKQMGYEFSLGHNLLEKETANNFGHFFTPDKYIAQRYAEDFFQTDKGYILDVFLNSKNFLDLTQIGFKTYGQDFISILEKNKINFKLYEYLKKDILNYEGVYDEIDKIWMTPNIFDYFDSFPTLRNVFLENKIDGIKFLEQSRGGGITLVVFNSNQIKLADGTNTTFDTNNPDIRFANGGGVSTIDQYTSQSIKKAYVSIRIKYESGRAENDKFFNKYEIKSFDEKTFEELKDHKLKGILGVSTSNYNLSEWLVHRECLVVMPFDKFKELNDTEQVQYYDADYLTQNGLEALYRLYDRKGRTDQDYYSILQNLFPKISNEFNLEGMVKKGSDYTNMYVISDWFNVYNSGNFIRHVAKQDRISSPQDLAKIVVDYANSEQVKNDYPYNRSVENITIESIIQPIIKGIINSGRIYVDESEWLIKNQELNIPENSQLFFVLKDYDNMRSKYDEIISKYDLKSSYKIAFINQKNLNELQSKRFNLKDVKWKAEYQKARTEVEKRILKSLQNIQNEIIEKWTNKIIEDFKESNSNDNYKDYDGNQYGDNIFEVPSAIIYFDSLMLRFIDIYNSRIDNILKTKSKYAFVDIFNDFTRYIEDLKDKEGNEELGVKTEWHHIYKYDLLQKLLYGIRIGDYYNLDNIGERIKSEVGSDLYRYFSKDEINFKNGGQPKQSKMKKQLLCPVGTEVQTLIFSKDNFTEKSAKDWAKKHDFNYGYVDKKENTFRIRQQEPSDFKNMRTIEMTKGLKAVIGCPKKKYLDGGDVYAEGGNVRTLLNRFDKEKPQISLYVIADEVADSLLFDDYKQKGIDNAWATLKDEQKEKYNQDYRVFKEQLYKYMIYNFVRLYYSDAKVREKCKGQSRLTIDRIKMFLNNIGGQYDKAKYPSIQKDSKEEILNLIEVLQPLAESGNEEALNLIEILKDTISGQKFNDGGEIWKLTKEEYAKDTITVHSGDNLSRKKTDLESYYENNITNRLHAYAVKKAIQEGKYEDAIRNGIMTRERANEIISGAKLDNGGGIDNADFDIKNIIEKTGFSEGLKQMLVNDFSESGYSNVEMLFANTPKNLPLNQKIWATSKNIQQKINGFSSGKNTYLQANKIAEIMYSVLASVPEVEQKQPILQPIIEEQPVIIEQPVIQEQIETAIVENPNENKKQDIEDLIEVLQPIADEGNQEAIELISTLRDVLDAEFPQMKHGGQTEFLHSGKADKLTLKQIAKKHNVDLSVIERQFNLGMGIESEHTNNKKLQAEIVKDHLTEYPNYYTALIKMESYLDKQKAEEGIIIDNEDGFYIDLDDSIDSNNFLIVLMMDGIKYVEVPSNNPLKRRIEFNSERDFDKAIISLNKFLKQENEAKSNFQPPQNLNQLKNVLNKGFKLKIVYHRARPTEVGNIRQVEIKQTNAVAYRDLSKPQSDLIWFYFPKPQDLEFSDRGFSVYYSGEPSVKMVSYEYFFDERDEKAPKKELTEREMKEKMIEYLRLLGD